MFKGYLVGENVRCSPEVIMVCSNTWLELAPMMLRQYYVYVNWSLTPKWHFLFLALSLSLSPFISALLDSYFWSAEMEHCIF